MTTQRVSTTSSGQQADGDNELGSPGFFEYGPTIISSVYSPDGNKILFSTTAPDLGSTGGSIIVLKDLTTGAIQTVSASLDNASNATFSPNGSAILFQAANYASSTAGNSEIYEVGANGGAPVLVSSSSAGSAADASATLVSVSSDGSRVAFTSSADNLIAGAPGSGSGSESAPATFVKDLSTNQLVQVGSASYETQVAFTSDLRGALIASFDQTTARTTLAYENLTTGAVQNVDSDAAGNAGNGTYVGGEFFTPDGSQVVYGSTSTNLSASAPQGGIFVKTLSTGALQVLAADSEATTSTTDVGTEYDLNAVSSKSAVAFTAANYDDTTGLDGSTTETATSQLEIRWSSGVITNVTSQLASTSTSKTSGGTAQQPTSATYTNDGANVGNVLFSPDGSKVAYTEFTAHDETSNINYATQTFSSSGSSTVQIFVYDLASGQTVAVSSILDANQEFVYGLEFSPDGTKVAYQTNTASIVADTSTGQQTVLPSSGSSYFSPDSQSVAYASSSASLVPGDTNNASDIFTQTVCFASGTRLLTARGEVEVETLAVGDLVVTSQGALRPIRWLGHRTIALTHHPRPHEARPIRIAAHAFGPDRPARDLRVSPGHALCLDLVGEVLIPAGELVNGATIVQDDVASVTYWHVECDEHEILLAENMPAESYLDMGNRAFFAGEATVDLAASPDAAALSDDAGFCRPIHRRGPLIDFARRRLVERAEGLGWRLEGKPHAGLHLLTRAGRIEPTFEGLVARFRLPAGCGGIQLMSSTSVPAHVGAGQDDRALGVCVGALVLTDRDGRCVRIGADDPCLCDGFHQAEAGPQRWTKGRACLAPTLWSGLAGEIVLEIELTRPALPSWTAPGDAIHEARSSIAA